MNIIDTLYRLLDRAEKEKDYEAAPALRWVLGDSPLEEKGLKEERIDKLYELLERAGYEKNTYAAIALRWAITTFGAGGDKWQRNRS